MVDISISTIQKDALTDLLNEGHKLAISEITIFELSAKAAKYVAKSQILSERVTRGIRALIYDDSIEKIPIYNTKILSTAFTLKSLMADFIDCLILSTAINYCEALISEDNVIRKLSQNQKYIELLSAINPSFKCESYNNFRKPDLTKLE